MMGINMGEKPGKSSRNALRNYMLLAAAFSIALAAALFGLNQTPPGQPPTFSTAGGLLILAVFLPAFGITTVRYLKRTDEHDLMANLWSLSIGGLVMTVMAPVWWVLNRSGLAGPVEIWPIYFTSTLVGAAVWLWLRFR